MSRTQAECPSRGATSEAQAVWRLLRMALRSVRWRLTLLAVLSAFLWTSDPEFFPIIRPWHLFTGLALVWMSDRSQALRVWQALPVPRRATGTALWILLAVVVPQGLLLGVNVGLLLLAPEEWLGFVNWYAINAIKVSGFAASMLLWVGMGCWLIPGYPSTRGKASGGRWWSLMGPSASLPSLLFVATDALPYWGVAVPRFVDFALYGLALGVMILTFRHRQGFVEYFYSRSPLTGETEPDVQDETDLPLAQASPQRVPWWQPYAALAREVALMAFGFLLLFAMLDYYFVEIVEQPMEILHVGVRFPFLLAFMQGLAHVPPLATLRVLPLPARALTLRLVAFPMVAMSTVAAVCVPAGMALVAGGYVPGGVAAELGAVAAVALGASLLAVAGYLLFGGRGLFAVPLLAGIVAAFVTEGAAGFALAGVIGSAVGVGLIEYAIRFSSAAYRRDRRQPLTRRFVAPE